MGVFDKLAPALGRDDESSTTDEFEDHGREGRRHRRRRHRRHEDDEGD